MPCRGGVLFCEFFYHLLSPCGDEHYLPRDDPGYIDQALYLTCEVRRDYILRKLMGHTNCLWGQPGRDLYNMNTELDRGPSGREDICHIRTGAECAECPGWRFLTSFPSCPPELRLPEHVDVPQESQWPSHRVSWSSVAQHSLRPPQI